MEQNLEHITIELEKVKNELEEMKIENKILKERLKKYTRPERCVEYYESHKEELLRKGREYKEKNKEHIQKQKAEYNKKYYQKKKEALIQSRILNIQNE